MGHLRDEEQYLFETAAEFLAQITELEKLREAVRLGRVDIYLSQSRAAAIVTTAK
jgi:hypothetical protein